MKTNSRHTLTTATPNTIRKLLPQGFSLVELMIGMALGLFIIGGVISVFVANQQAARTTEGLSRIQENSRIAFEMLSRKIRESGGSACDPAPPQTVNVITGAPAWWGAASAGVRGYSGTDVAPFVAFGTEAANTAATRVPNTDALALSGSSDSIAITAHNPWAQQGFGIPPGNNPFVVGDIVNICNATQGAIFYVLATSNAGFNPSPPGNAPTGGWGGVFYGQGCATPSVCNCSEFLGGLSTEGCSNRNNNGNNGINNFTYPVGSTLAKLENSAWFIGFTARTDSRGTPIRSLYRMLNNSAAEEIAEGVDNLRIEYLLMNPSTRVPANNAVYQNAGAITLANWGNVIAIRLTLTLSDIQTGTRTDNTNNSRLDRTMTQTVTLRSRAL